MLLGSCFAQHIANKLRQHKFNVATPFGVLYNPLSIANSLYFLLNKTQLTDKDIFLQHDVWKSYAFHSAYNNTSAQGLLHTLQEEINQSHTFLQQCNTLIITLGTAYVYYLNETNQVVANCHKTDAKAFTRKRVSLNEIVHTYTHLLTTLKAFNPSLQVICTVSPIRHWKDGAHSNQLSKSILLLAIESLQEQFDFVNYFPAYELVLDDLRDYRFYEQDMLHPNSTAIDYVWQHFSNTYFSEETKEINSKVYALTKNEIHKPISPESERYKEFMEQHAKKVHALRTQYPFLKL